MIFVTQSTQDLQELESQHDPRPAITPHAYAVLAKLDESSPLSDQLQALTKDIGLRDRELMKLAGVSRSTLARWRKEGEGDRPPPIDDLRAIAALLIRSGAMRPQSVSGWLRSRNEGLASHRPLEVLQQGDFSLVLSAAESACGARIPVKKIPQLIEDNNPAFSSAADEKARSSSNAPDG